MRKFRFVGSSESPLRHLSATSAHYCRCATTTVCAMSVHRTPARSRKMHLSLALNTVYRRHLHLPVLRWRLDTSLEHMIQDIVRCARAPLSLSLTTMPYVHPQHENAASTSVYELAIETTERGRRLAFAQFGLTTAAAATGSWRQILGLSVDLSMEMTTG